MGNKEKGSLQQTAESLKLLGAGEPYKIPDADSTCTAENKDDTWSSVQGPWNQRHPQGKWK